MSDNNKVSLLYLYGYTPIDQLIEEKYQGEDVFVKLSKTENGLTAEIENNHFNINNSEISLIELQYLESLIILTINNDECQLSFEDLISKELLNLIFDLNCERKIPKYLQDRHLQYIENEGLLDLVLSLKETIPPNDYLHFYPFISEYALIGIVESFASQAITEVPLIYAKYVNSDEKELGLLVTSKKMYSPENTILLTDVNSIAYDEDFGISDTITLIVNGQFFTNMKIIVWDKSMTSFSGMYKREFKTKEFLNMIVQICNFLIMKKLQTQSRL